MAKPSQVKSKARVADHGEVFTGEREVNAMLDLVKQETERIDSRFLEPACGNGNFLAEILRRKLAVVGGRYARNRVEYERYAVLAVSSIYGIDLLPDNVSECRQRLFEIADSAYATLYKAAATEAPRQTIRYILSKNIVCGDALTLKVATGELIVFCEWALVRGSKFKRRDFTFSELLEPNADSQLGLFQAAMTARERATRFIPTPVAEYPLTNFWELSSYG